MSLVLVAAAGLALGVGCEMLIVHLRRRRALGNRFAARRIAFPFTGLGLSEPALAAALRIARAEGAVLMPVYLALVPRELPLDVGLMDGCEPTLALLEAIEQRAARADVAVDSRIERGRSVRHALAQLFIHERFERMVVAASAQGQPGLGFSPEDAAWLLGGSPGEVLVLRTAPVTVRSSGVSSSSQRHEPELNRRPGPRYPARRPTPRPTPRSPATASPPRAGCRLPADP